MTSSERNKLMEEISNSKEFKEAFKPEKDPNFFGLYNSIPLFEKREPLKERVIVRSRFAKALMGIQKNQKRGD